MHRSVTFSRFLPAAALAAAMVFVPAARADDAPGVSPLHGGQLISYPHANVRLEGVLDSKSGTLTLYGMAIGGKMPSADLDPVLVLSDGTEIRIPKLSGQENAWQLRDERLEKGLATAGIRIHVDGKATDAPWTRAVPDGLSPAPVGPAPRFGGRTFAAQGGSIEVVREGNRCTLYVFDASGSPATLDQAPSLVLNTATGERSVAMEAVTGKQGTWRTSEIALDGSSSSRVDVVLLGRAQRFALADAPQAGLRSGVLAFRGGPSLRVVCNSDHSTVRLEPLTPADAQAIQEAPSVMVGSGDEIRALVVKTVASNGSTAWVIEGKEIFRPGAGAHVRLTANQKTYIASLADVTSSERGTRGGMIVRFAEDAVALEVVQDPRAGTLTVYSLEPITADSRVVRDAPVVSLETEQGTQVLHLEAVADQPGVWRITSPYLRSARMSGRVQMKVGDRSLEAPLPTAGQADAQTGNAVPAVRHGTEVTK